MSQGKESVHENEARSRLVGFLLAQGNASADTPIGDEQNLFDSGLLDSMGMFNLLVFLSEEFGVVLTELEPERVSTITSILKLAEARA